MSCREIVVLGAGRIGWAIALDLAGSHPGQVLVADRSESALARLAERGLAVERTDLANPDEVGRLAAGRALVVGALPSAFGFEALRAVVDSGTPYVDISFFPEDPLSLDAFARERRVPVVVDCGLAPGLSNLIAGRMAAELDPCERFLCFVGGLPAVPRPPWRYKAPFAPSDVLEEYTRPARLVRGGKVVTLDALSEVERLEVPGVGELEAFNTDGLRTLLTTVEIPEMAEKTIRYPGHAREIRVLRDTGLLDTEPIEVEGVRVTPRDLTARLLFDHWRFEPEEEDLAVFVAKASGRRDGRREVHRFTLVDRRDPATGFSAMARTTGFAATAVARRLLDGSWRRPGVSAMEHMGADPRLWEVLLADLAERDITFEHTIETG